MTPGRVWAVTIQTVRAPLWWTPKLLPVVAACELSALASGTPGSDGVARVVATLFSAIAIAAGAHLVNDISDRAADAAAGKFNALSRMSPERQAMLLGACAAGGLLPWSIVSLDPWAGATLVALVLASLAYSLPPLRLKGRAHAGIVLDALVAHTLPTTFAFLELSGAPASVRDSRWAVAFVAAIAWSTAFGLRSIVVHQVLDTDGDRAAGVRTFVVDRGIPRAVRTGRDAVAVEITALAVLAVVAGLLSWGTAVFFAGHLGLWWFHRRFDRRTIDTVPTSAGAWLPLAEFYEVWPAVVLGVALAVGDATWWWSTGATVIVFGPAVAKQAGDELALIGDAGHAFAVLTRQAAAKLAHYCRVVGHALARAGYAVLRAIRSTGAAVAAAWWAAYRAFWRVNRRIWGIRHRVFDPVGRFRRRHWRRLARRLGRPPGPEG